MRQFFKFLCRMPAKITIESYYDSAVPLDKIYLFNIFFTILQFITLHL